MQPVKSQVQEQARVAAASRIAAAFVSNAREYRTRSFQRFRE